MRKIIKMYFNENNWNVYKLVLQKLFLKIKNDIL